MYAIQAFTHGIIPVPCTAEQIERNRLQIAANKRAWAAFLDAQKAGLSDAECCAIHAEIANTLR